MRDTTPKSRPVASVCGLDVAKTDPRFAGSGCRLPDFFIVGHGKSGTTALFIMLRSHPQVYMPYKEPWFFADELRSAAALRPSAASGRTPRTLDEYLSLFDRAALDQRVGEASSVYLWSRSAADRIADTQPEARIIAVLREPASFVRSLHMQFVQNYVEPVKNLRKAIALENARREGRGKPPGNPYWPGGTLYSEHVRYVEQLRRYHALFPPEQVLVLIYDDFRHDNESVVRKVWRFVGVDDTHPLRARDVNPTVRVRSRRLHAVAHELSTGRGALPRAVQATARALAPPSLTRHRAVAIRDRFFYARPNAPDEALMLELRRRFKPEVVALSEYLGRDLVTLWGYDRVE